MYQLYHVAGYIWRRVLHSNLDLSLLLPLREFASHLQDRLDGASSRTAQVERTLIPDLEYASANVAREYGGVPQ